MSAFKKSNIEVNFFNLLCVIKFEHRKITEMVRIEHKLKTSPILRIDNQFSNNHNSSKL